MNKGIIVGIGISIVIIAILIGMSEFTMTDNPILNTDMPQDNSGNQMQMSDSVDVKVTPAKNVP